MQPELSRVIEQVSKEKGIDRSIVVQAVENAMLSAAKKVIGGDMRIEAQYNPEIGEVELFKILTVVEQVSNAETARLRSWTRAGTWTPRRSSATSCSRSWRQSYGRIAAQAAKQSHHPARARRGARQHLQRVQGPQGRADALRHRPALREAATSSSTSAAPRRSCRISEQIPRERYRQGDRIRAYILDVEMSAQGPQIVLSRTHPGLAR